MGTHGRTGFDRLLLGSVTEQVLRKAPCPVLTVPPHAPGSPAGVVLRTILCPTDFSSAGLQAVGFAVDVARRANVSLIVLQVIEWLAEEEPREFAHFDVPEFRRYLMQDTRERLRALIAEQPRVEHGAEARVVAGRAYREILRVAAEEGAELIRHGRTRTRWSGAHTTRVHNTTGGARSLLSGADRPRAIGGLGDGETTPMMLMLGAA